MEWSTGLVLFLDQVVPGWLRGLAARLSDRAKKKKAMARNVRTSHEEKLLSNAQIIEQNTFGTGPLHQPAGGPASDAHQRLKCWPPPNPNFAVTRSYP